jgi:hypothetical protein
MASYDKDGNYIPTKGDILNDKARLRNTQFQKDVELFLNKHNIKGEPYSYGFATTNPNEVSEKLQRLGIKFKLKN